MRTESFSEYLGPIGYDEPMTKKQDAKELKPAVKPEPRFEIPAAKPAESEFTMTASDVSIRTIENGTPVLERKIVRYAGQKKIPCWDRGEGEKPRFMFRPKDIPLIVKKLRKTEGQFIPGEPD